LRQAEGFGEELKKQLVPIVATAYYSSGLSDFSAQIAAFKAAGVDTVYMPGQAKDAATIMKQSFDLGLRWMYLGSPDWSSQELYSANNSSTIAHYFPLSYSIEHDSLLNKTFVATFTDQFKSAPSSISAWGYDSLNLAIAGAMASKMPNSIVALKDSLKELKSFEGVSGVYRMNKEGFNEKGVFIMETQTLRAHIKKVL